MNKKIILILILTIFTSTYAKADEISRISDFTGDSFFGSPHVIKSDKQNYEIKVTSSEEKEKSIPPIKLLRLKITQKIQEHNKSKNELAPTLPVGDVSDAENSESEYASKELKEDFDSESSPDGFEADEETAQEIKKTKRGFFRKNKKEEEPEPNEDIILDCDNVDYDTPNYIVYARGNVNVLFVNQGTTLKADLLTYDRANNTIKAEGNVRIIKNEQVITGEYIFVDMNEENALITNPYTKSPNIEMHSKEGYVYGDRTVQKNGTLDVVGSFPISLGSGTYGPRTLHMLRPKEESLTADLEKGRVKLIARDIKITRKGDLETIAFKKFKLIRGDRTIIKMPAIKAYTNKTHDYLETNIFEVGSYRDLGVFAGPNWVFELPKGSVLKVIPSVIYKSGFGLGAYGRFSSGTNKTFAGYGTAAKQFILFGEQRLDDNVRLQYAMNEYMNEWFLGRRRPKYGAELYYMKDYNARNFLLKNQISKFEHRLGVGMYKDLDHDLHYEKLRGAHISTMRMRYMANAEQTFINYENEDNLTSFQLSLDAQLSASLYGTGDTQMIGRLGPKIHTQYKRWMQDVGFYLSAYEDNTPMPVFDAYRYGKQNLFIREYFRLCRYLTVCWFGSINVSNDSPNGQAFQENAFYLSLGPDEVKLNIGYDFIRENLHLNIEMLMDPKGAHVEYDTFEIKQTKKAKKDETKDNTKTANQAPVGPQVLDKAVVENVKIMEDVL